MAIKIKYCGLKLKSEIDLSCQLNIDAIGLVFVNQSPRYVSVVEAVALANHLRGNSSQVKPKLVALFVNPETDFVQRVIDEVQPDVLQFHGQEPPEFCQQFNHIYWKAIAMIGDESWLQQIECHYAAEYCLLDAFQPGKLGGTGKTFDWFEFPEPLRDRLILAGGLNIDSVKQALKQTQSNYLDVSSGIESSRGVKSPTLMKQFMQLVNPS